MQGKELSEGVSLNSDAQGLSDHEKHLVVGVDADPSELERGKLWSQVRAETIFKLMSLDTASYADRVALVGTNDQHGVTVEVP